MAQAKDTKPATPYDVELQGLENTDDLTLGELGCRSRLRAKREGYLAHSEHFCGSESCACYCYGVDAGLDQAGRARREQDHNGNENGK